RRSARLRGRGHRTGRHARNSRCSHLDGAAQPRTAPRPVRWRPRRFRQSGAGRMSRKETIRIASGQGFWGDRLQAPVEQVRRGPIDYLMLDYLAEVTMSIMQKQRSRDPSQGYARDFVPLMGEIFADCVQRDIRVVANAGGVNADACAEAVLAEARRGGLSGRARVGVVTG